MNSQAPCNYLNVTNTQPQWGSVDQHADGGLEKFLDELSDIDLGFSDADGGDDGDDGDSESMIVTSAQVDEPSEPAPIEPPARVMLLSKSMLAYVRAIHGLRYV
jgi:hypothetical protein